MKLKKHLFVIFYSLALIAFTAYLLLDTFVIVRVYDKVDSDESLPSISLPPQITIPSSPEESEPEGESGVLGGETDPGEAESSETEATEPEATEPEETEPVIIEPIITDSSYIDQNISINIVEYFAYDTKIYVADIYLSSIEYLKTALAKDQYGRNITEKTSSMATRVGAILAINGDYYGARETGYVLRNGVLYRTSPTSNRDDLAVLDDGSFIIAQETMMSAELMEACGALQIFTFGPGLLVDGEIVVGEKDEVAVSSSKGNPRTAIGIVDDLHYVIVVSDGRTKESTGLSLYQLAEVMQALGVDTGYNLDGGGSSTLWFNGKIINYPTTDGKKLEERSVSDIVYIGY